MEIFCSMAHSQLPNFFSFDPQTGFSLPADFVLSRQSSGSVTPLPGSSLVLPTPSYNRHYGSALQKAISVNAHKVDRRPEELSRHFDQCDYWGSENPFVSEMIRIRSAFTGFGFRVFVQEKDSSTWELASERSENDSVRDWWITYGQEIAEFELNFWTEWHQFQNAVVYWRDSYMAVPGFLPLINRRTYLKEPEGIPSVEYEHGLTRQQIDKLVKMGVFTKEAGEYYKNHSRVVLDEDRGERYQIFRETAPGKGFGIPKMKTVFDACDVMESLGVGDKILGDESRVLQKLHKLGHKIESGPHAGLSVHFIKKVRSDTVKKDMFGKPGRTEAAVNFDHDIEHVYLDPKFFDGKKYDGAMLRLMYWAAPLGHMLEATQQSVRMLMPILKIQCETDRKRVAGGIAAVIQDRWSSPGRVRVSWGTQCFVDPALMFGFLKAGRNDGTLSDQTVRESFGFDNDEENRRKEQEAQQPSAMHFPIYDGNHGNSGDGGRPAGKDDSRQRDDKEN